MFQLIRPQKRAQPLLRLRLAVLFWLKSIGIRSLSIQSRVVQGACHAVDAWTGIMRQEIAELVELLARSAYQRWRAGEPVCDAGVGQANLPNTGELPIPAHLAYDRQATLSVMERSGCASTPTPGTAPTGKQKPP